MTDTSQDFYSHTAVWNPIGYKFRVILCCLYSWIGAIALFAIGFEHEIPQNTYDSMSSHKTRGNYLVYNQNSENRKSLQHKSRFGQVATTWLLEAHSKLTQSTPGPRYKGSSYSKSDTLDFVQSTISIPNLNQLRADPLCGQHQSLNSEVHHESRFSRYQATVAFKPVSKVVFCFQPNASTGDIELVCSTKQQESNSDKNRRSKTPEVEYPRHRSFLEHPREVQEIEGREAMTYIWNHQHGNHNR